MTCRHCGEPAYIGNSHPCCDRHWNGRYCLSCEASKAFWRSNPSRKRKP